MTDEQKAALNDLLNLIYRPREIRRGKLKKWFDLGLLTTADKAKADALLAKVRGQ